jgi:hypothetical protein
MCKLSVLAIAASLVFLANSSFAQCNYDTDPLLNCGEAAGDWFQQNTGNWSDSFDDVRSRVESAGDVIQECQECAMGAVEDGVD